METRPRKISQPFTKVSGVQPDSDHAPFLIDVSTFIFQLFGVIIGTIVFGGVFARNRHSLEARQVRSLYNRLRVRILVCLPSICGCHDFF